MHDVHWDDIPLEERKRICRTAGISETCAKYPWNEWIPPAKKRLARALEDLSGGAATLNMPDWELLEQRRWDSLSEEEKHAEYAEWTEEETD
jgi:hypothetical protein